MSLAQLESAAERRRNNASVSIAARQAPLRRRYAEGPDEAWISDHARTSCADVPADQPLYTRVTCGIGRPVEIPVGVHAAVGGESDDPVPGEILSAAIASCLDTAIRMIANLKGIALAHLEVAVAAKIDVRGTLQMDRKVPVGFQEIDVSVAIAGAPGVSDGEIDRLLQAAEYSCVVLQTFRRPPAIRITRNESPC